MTPIQAIIEQCQELRENGDELSDVEQWVLDTFEEDEFCGSPEVKFREGGLVKAPRVQLKGVDGEWDVTDALAICAMILKSVGAGIR